MEYIKTTSAVLMIVIACSAGFYAGYVQNEQVIAELDKKIISLQQAQNDSMPAPILAKVMLNSSFQGEIIDLSDDSITIHKENGQKISLQILNSTRIEKSMRLSPEEYQKIRQDFDAWLAGKKQNDSSFPDIKPPLSTVEMLIGLSELQKGNTVKASASHHFENTDYVATEIIVTG